MNNSETYPMADSFEKAQPVAVNEVAASGHGARQDTHRVEGLSVFYGETRVVARYLVDQDKQGHCPHRSVGLRQVDFYPLLNRMHEVTPGARVEGQSASRRRGSLWRPASTRSHVRRRVGMVFQKPNPFPTMSSHDNVIAGFKLKWTPGPEKSSMRVVEKSLRMRRPLGRSEGQAAQGRA